MIKQFDDGELAAWVDEQLGTTISGYVLQPGEFTTSQYMRDSSLTRTGAAKRLEKLVNAGMLSRRFEIIHGNRKLVFKIEVQE